MLVPARTRHVHVVQAVFTNSVFVMDWTRPVPIEEYFLPLDERLLFPDFRACLDVLELSRCDRQFSLDLRHLYTSVQAVPHAVLCCSTTPAAGQRSGTV